MWAMTETTTYTVVAYAVHVEGALWDDPDISAWTESLADAAAMMERAAAFFEMGEEGVPLLTIVRAEFTPEEWATTRANGWTLG
jgi:hypothetical protein